MSAKSTLIQNRRSYLRNIGNRASRAPSRTNSPAGDPKGEIRVREVSPVALQVKPGSPLSEANVPVSPVHSDRDSPRPIPLTAPSGPPHANPSFAPKDVSSAELASTSPFETEDDILELAQIMSESSDDPAKARRSVSLDSIQHPFSSLDGLPGPHPFTSLIPRPTTPPASSLGARRVSSSSRLQSQSSHGSEMTSSPSSGSQSIRGTGQCTMLKPKNKTQSNP